MWFQKEKFMGWGKAEPRHRTRESHYLPNPVIAQGNHITFRYCRVLYLNERWEENRRHVIFIFRTTLLSVSIYTACNFHFPYNLIISEYLRGTSSTITILQLSGEWGEWLFTLDYITSVEAPLISISFTVDAAINKNIKKYTLKCLQNTNSPTNRLKSCQNYVRYFDYYHFFVIVWEYFPDSVTASDSDD